jgi:hypothetical protein
MSKKDSHNATTVVNIFTSLFITPLVDNVGKMPDPASLDQDQQLTMFKAAVASATPAAVVKCMQAVARFGASVAPMQRRAHKAKEEAAGMDDYLAYLRGIDNATFAVLDNAWLSSYDVQGHVPAKDLDAGGAPVGSESTFAVYTVAKEKGFAPLGIVTEKMKKATDGSDTKVHVVQVVGPRVYVGPYQKLVNLPASIFSRPPSPKDSKKFKGAGAGAGAGAGNPTASQVSAGTADTVDTVDEEDDGDADDDANTGKKV